MKVGGRRITYDDLARMPEDRRRYELYDGEVYVVPSPILRHQIVALRIFQRLADYAKRAGGLAVASPIDVVFSDYDVVQPDVVYLRRKSIVGLSLDGPIRRVPELVVEVLSPSTSRHDRTAKLAMFRRYGVPECWIVDPVAEIVEVHQLNASRADVVTVLKYRDALRSVTLPDLTFDISGILTIDLE